MTIKNIVNKFISFWNKFFPKMNQIKLTKNQRKKATTYLFIALEKVSKENKISQMDYDMTLQDDINKDADAIFVMLQKNNLVDDVLTTQLKSLGTLEYFENLKIEDFLK